MTKNTFKRIVELKSFFTYISSIVNLGYGTQSEKSTLAIAILSSILLSIASGYTTFQGLLSYTPWIVALFLTIGIQGMLFAVSWRMAFAAASKEYSIPLFLIFLVTIGVSVFFSYSSLLTVVYEKDTRKQDRDYLATAEARKILAEINENRNENLEEISFSTEYEEWKKSANKTIQQIGENISSKLDQAYEKSLELENIYKKELRYGGTKYPNSNDISPPGPGPISDKLKLIWDNHKNKILQPLQNSYNFFEEESTRFRDSISDYEANKLEPKKLRKASALCTEIAHKFYLQDARCSLYKFEEKINEFEGESKRRKKFSSDCEVNNTISFKDAVNKINNCISVSELTSDKQEILLERIRTFSSSEGEHAHHFIWVTKELARYNILAIGALLLALVIDILILLCGILGSKHESFLNIEKAGDLISMQDYPLEVILSCDINNPTENLMLRRIHNIITHSEFDEDSAQRGFAAVISAENIKKLGLQKEIGVFFSMGLMEPLDSKGYKKYGLKTKFILWMCDQSFRSRYSKKTSDDLYHDLEKI